MRDVVYIFDKLSPYTRIELGEIQIGFDMSFVIDGNKDSSKIIVCSFSGVEVEPFTILKHENTNTWWCVVKDKVERYTNESGFVYLHTIQLEGAKELLNARDLIDSGFNQQRYTIDTFLKRLFNHSKFEYDVSFIYGNNIAYYESVDFVKTFENYTLSSALREFLDGYNCDFKLTFAQYDSGNLKNAIITIIPKTGNVELPILNADNFKDIREIKKIDKNSFGTTVVSNAENVISSVAKTYPSQGSVRLSATEYEIKDENAIIRLPSKAYIVNWLKMKYRAFMYLEYGDTSAPNHLDLGRVDFDNPKSIDNFIAGIKNQISQQPDAVKTQLLEDFEAQEDEFIENLKLATTITFYNGNDINTVDGTIVKGNNVPYIPSIYRASIWTGYKQVILCEKEIGDCLPYKEQGIIWERGKNTITRFNFLNSTSPTYGASINEDYTNTDLQESKVYFYRYNEVGDYCFRIKIIQENLKLSNTSYVVNYLPMSDLKIEIDNQRSTKDIQLYNQNGKLTDSVALSKILNSYSREISSNNVTRYMDYYGFNNCPKVGQMVTYNNELYVINNLSLDFYPNENDSYFINAEINMCKYVSTKSLMVNPNTNIRDYGIPQNFNVKRKQLYRDYLEFDYTQDTRQDGEFYSSNIPLSFDMYGYTPKTHTVAIRCEYAQQVDSSYYWYYQLETTMYRLDKMTIEIVDFNDNNIIGYGSQNSHSAFQVSRIFTGLLATINTPISYVDDNGEVKGLILCWANDEQLTNAWYDYQDNEGYGSNTNYNLSNYSCFIPQDVFDYLTSDNEIQIQEDEYYKDATEVPVFEYVFQVGDSDNVLIGDKILDNIKNVDMPNHTIFWFYGFVQADANTLNQNNALINSKDVDDSGLIATLEDMVLIDDFYDNRLYISLANTTKTLLPNKDYAIYRIEWNATMSVELQRQLVMVIKNLPSSAIEDGEIRLYKNKYKLK